MKYAIVGKYVSKGEVVGFAVSEIHGSNMSMSSERLTRDRVIYHCARGEIVNFKVIPVQNTVRLVGIHNTVESLPVIDDNQIQNNKVSNKIPVFGRERLRQERVHVSIAMDGSGRYCIDNEEETAIKTLVYSIAKQANERDIVVCDVTVEEDYSKKADTSRNEKNKDHPLVVKINFKRNNVVTCMELRVNIKARVGDITYCIVDSKSSTSGGTRKIRINWTGLRAYDNKIQSILVKLVDTVDNVLTVWASSHNSHRDIG